MAFRPQAQVDAPAGPLLGAGCQEAQHLAHDACKEFIDRNARSTAAGTAVFVVNEHQVDVAGVIELLPAELAERQTTAAGWLLEMREWPAESLTYVPKRDFQRNLEARVGDMRQIECDFFQRAITNYIIGADAQHLLLPVTTKSAQQCRIVADRVDLRSQLLAQLFRRRALPQRHPQHFKEIRIGDEDIGKELARAQQRQECCQAGSIVFEELVEHAGCSRKIALQVVPGHVRVGIVRQQAGQWLSETLKALVCQQFQKSFEHPASALRIAQTPAGSKGSEFEFRMRQHFSHHRQVYALRSYSKLERHFATTNRACLFRGFHRSKKCESRRLVHEHCHELADQ